MFAVYFRSSPNPEWRFYNRGEIGQARDWLDYLEAQGLDVQVREERTVAERVRERIGTLIG